MSKVMNIDSYFLRKSSSGDDDVINTVFQTSGPNTLHRPTKYR